MGLDLVSHLSFLSSGILQSLKCVSDKLDSLDETDLVNIIVKMRVQHLGVI